MWSTVACSAASRAAPWGRGALDDPAHKRAHMKTADAIAQPVEQSLSQLQALDETQRQQQQAQQLQDQQLPEQSVGHHHRLV
ncbi:hypothetical protein JWH04_04440 [Xanthomonas melonis]|nr:hypothetical protein [Xanthomonas melonis]